MGNRVHTARAEGENKERPWIVYVDGEKLRNARGAVRHFKWEHMARSAGWKSIGITVRADTWADILARANVGVDAPQGQKS